MRLIGADKKVPETPDFLCILRRKNDHALRRRKESRVKRNRTDGQRQRKQRMRNSQRRIERRLGDKDWEDQPGPMFRGGNIQYEIAERARGLTVGGIGLMQKMVQDLGLPARIDERLELLKVHLPYFESDHVLNIAYNSLVGGKSIEDIELRRNDEVFLDALGTERIPDPTTAGDFCRRFAEEDVEALLDAINETRLEVWKKQPEEFFEEALLDADGTLAPTSGECKEGMGISYKGELGLSPPRRLAGEHAGAALSLKSQRKPTVALGSRIPLRPGDRPLSACRFPENHAAGRHGLQPDRAAGSLARCGSRFPLRLRLNEGSAEKGVGARGIGLEATRAPREVPGQDEAASTTGEREEAHRQGARLQEPRS